MTLSDRLDEMRRALPDCALVSFGDLRTGLALRTSAAQQYKQDYLDGLLQQAAQSFAATDAASLSDMATGASVMVATPNELRIFVRSGHCASDVLCCVCDSADVQPQAEHAARAIFQSIATGL
jgi:hypothetical protein